MPLAKELLRRLRQNDQSLQIVDDAQNELDGSATKELVAALAHNTAVHTLNIQLRYADLILDNVFTRGMRAFAPLLKTNKTIRSLQLRLTFLDNKETQIFLEALQENKTIEMLDLRSTLWNRRESTPLVNGLAEILQTNTTIHTLNANYYWPLKTLDSLKTNTTLHTLGVGYLYPLTQSELLKTNTTIRTLIVGERLSDSHAIILKLFADILEFNTTLTALNFLPESDHPLAQPKQEQQIQIDRINSYIERNMVEDELKRRAREQEAQQRQAEEETTTLQEALRAFNASKDHLTELYNLQTEHLKTLEQQLQQVSQQNLVLNPLQAQQIQTMEALFARDQIQQQQLKSIQAHPNLKLFFNTFVIDFEALIIALKASGTQLIKPASSLPEQLGSGALKIAIKAIPIPIIGGIVGIIASGIDKLGEKQKQALAANFARLGTLNEFNQLGQQLALMLTLRYQQQITELLAPEEQFAYQQQVLTHKIKQKLGEIVFKTAEERYAATMAHFAIARIVNAVFNNDFKDPNNLKNQLLQCITRSLTFPQEVQAKLASVLGMNQVVNKQHRAWALGDLFNKPGLYTITQGKKQYYTTPDCDYRTYGFCLTDHDEVTKLNALELSDGEEFDLNEAISNEANMEMEEQVPQNDEQELQVQVGLLQAQLERQEVQIRLLQQQLLQFRKSALTNSEQESLDDGNGQLRVRMGQQNSIRGRDIAMIYQRSLTTHEEQLSLLTQAVAAHEETINTFIYAPSTSHSTYVSAEFQRLKNLAINYVEGYIRLNTKREKSLIYAVGSLLFFCEPLRQEKLKLARQLSIDINRYSCTTIEDLKNLLELSLNASKNLCERFESDEAEFEESLNYVLSQCPETPASEDEMGIDYEM
ncbi:hypothetical protein [Legionella rowbothamii]|uniref:hypothetical protein n=1 Tax=Legionella rowbothamii TaxID=96229 RepID=UPI001055FC12|nr:hypothetical protein [Legionella rowbothamii]